MAKQEKPAKGKMPKAPTKKFPPQKMKKGGPVKKGK